ncbi:MAG: V-type ATP synthase subunit I [Treponema sp.]|jgi:V/A-type H+-transporting ATPase subunit I|nr:V-type ATP synthase subunit I [Treponema sp.]
MIVPMKKASIILATAAQEKDLEKIRDLGVIHIEKKTVSSESLAKVVDQKNKAETALGVLRTYKTAKNAARFAIEKDVTARVLDLVERRKNLQEQRAFLLKETSRIEKWGDFSPSALKELADRGVILIPYELTNKAYAALKDEPFIVLAKDKTGVRGVAVGREIVGESPFALPQCSLAELNDKAARVVQELGAIEIDLQRLAENKSAIESDLKIFDKTIEFETASAGLEKASLSADFSLSLLTGWAPAETVDALKVAAAENGWALVTDDPAEEDKPPTLVRNNAFVRLIAPLFNFLGTVPGYREYDISFSYLLFFCLFFAMIFGDAAYGTLIFVITFCIGLNYKKKTGRTPDAVKLFGLLSLCTIVWGALNGAWFAMPYEKLPSALQTLVLPQFNSDIPLSPFPGVLQKLFKIPADQPSNTAYWNVQFLCFTTALIQLVWAHIKNIKKLLPSLVAVAQAGWLLMMIGLYFLVLSMLLQVELPGFAVYFIGIGLGTYFIFAEQRGGNPISNVGKSFANFLPTFLNAVSSFADIISYIRLFAVGLAGASIAQSFNSMAVGGGVGGSVLSVVLKIFAAALILAFGHGLNMVMNALSVIVHGVRLNLLEYAGNHLGMEWSGYAYKPFSK